MSSKAKDLIQKLLKVDPTERISASCALDHGWFTSLKIKEQLFDRSEALEIAKKNNQLKYKIPEYKTWLDSYEVNFVIE